MRIVFVSSAFTRVTLIPLSINARRSVRNTSGRTEGLSTRQIDFCPALCQLLFWAVPAQPESAKAAEESARIRQDFNLAASLFDEVKTKYFADADGFCERSWGMSGDYKIAIGCRSTMVRIGTAVFGEREY